MTLAIFAYLKTRSTPRRREAPRPRFRPVVEAMETRVVPSAVSPMPAALGPALHGASPLQIAPVQMVPISINNIVAQAGQLVANGSVGSTAFQVPLTMTSSPNAADPSCPILNLAIPQGIHLSLLGLNVDTSGICLSITGQEGSGNLLGNLVCDLANALNPGGAGLLNFLNTLTTTDLNSLLGGLGNLLNTAVTDVTTATLTNSLGAATPSVQGADTNILNLSLGPVNLNLLGLDVNLDNCQGGPVTVDITATSGPGNLLGNLLGNLSHLLDSNAGLGALENSLGRIANDILTLI